jgi:FAD-dependent oxidoreductase domain-containing protein 1
MTCHYLINCAGPSATNIARMAGIGSSASTADALSDDEQSVLSVDLPVHMRKRMVFVFSCREARFDRCPLVVLPGGAYFRKEGKDGGTFICGQSPPLELDVDSADLTIDYDFFDETIWPHIARYVPVFNSVKLQHAWAGYYDYNTLDQNAIIGAHPVIKNFVFCNGFSGHGLQQSMAAGRAVSEIVVDGRSVSLNLGRLGFERIVLSTPLKERNVV